MMLLIGSWLGGFAYLCYTAFANTALTANRQTAVKRAMYGSIAITMQPQPPALRYCHVSQNPKDVGGCNHGVLCGCNGLSSW